MNKKKKKKTAVKHRNRKDVRNIMVDCYFLEFLYVKLKLLYVPENVPKGRYVLKRRCTLSYLKAVLNKTR